MIMCKAEVTGSFTPTVAKQIQSVEPVGVSSQNTASEPFRSNLNCYSESSQVMNNKHSITSRDDANM